MVAMVLKSNKKTLSQCDIPGFIVGFRDTEWKLHGNVPTYGMRYFGKYVMLLATTNIELSMKSRII